MCGQQTAGLLLPHHSIRNELQPFLHSSDLYDMWRCANSDEKDFTYYSDPQKSYSRIDLFVSELPLLQNVLLVTIHSITWSDHAPVSLLIKEHHNAAPVHLWLNNMAILKNSSYRDRLHGQINDFFLCNDIPETNVFFVVARP